MIDYPPFVSLVDKIIQKERASLCTDAGNDSSPNIMKIYFKTEGLSKSDIATSVLDMVVAGVETVGRQKFKIRLIFYIVILTVTNFWKLKNSVH